jgi:hypothetical protein
LYALTGFEKAKFDIFFAQLHFLQREQDATLDEKQFVLKQLQLRQLIQLKAKGRYLEETKFFVQ